MNVQEEQKQENFQQNKTVRTNGFSASPTISQIVLYFNAIFLICEFFFISVVALKTIIALIIVSCIIFPISIVASLAFALIASIIDPTDPTIKLERKCRENNEPFPFENYKYECIICQSHVESNRSKHCRSEERRVGKECRSRWSPYH